MTSHIVEVRDTWDIRPRELLGPYQTIGEADAQAQRIRHHDRAGRYTVLVTNIRASEPHDAAGYATEDVGDVSSVYMSDGWTYSEDDRFALASEQEKWSDYNDAIGLTGEVGA